MGVGVVADLRAVCSEDPSGDELERTEVVRYAELVVLPLEEFPLYNLHPRLLSVFQRIVDQRRGLFALVPAGSTLGTLCRVRAVSLTDDVLRARAVGVQPLRLLSSSRGIDGSEIGRAHLLSDVHLGSPLRNLEPSSWHRFRLSPPAPAVPAGGNRRTGTRAAAWAPFPRHSALRWQPDRMKARLLQSLHDWLEASQLDHLRLLGEAELSWTLAASLCLGGADKLALLNLRSPLERLAFLERAAGRLGQVQCGSCGRALAARKDVFSMSLKGPSASYVNPGGVVHEMLTVRTMEEGSWAEGSEPSEENSWFPGYAWTILLCGDCHGHLGWRFQSVRPSLRPALFFGLSRHSLRFHH